jgi:hypothetical protein
MQKTTKADLAARLALIDSSLAARGVTKDGHDLTLTPGSSTYGVAYRLMWRERSGGGLSAVIPGDGFLGFTAREAWVALGHLYAGLALAPIGGTK